jgi:hypothetical protein
MHDETQYETRSEEPHRTTDDAFDAGRERFADAIARAEGRR